MTEQTFNLDLIPGGIKPIIHVSQYDTGQIWKFNIVQNNQLFEIPEHCSVTIQGTKRDGTGFQYPCTYSGSMVTAVETKQMTIYNGDVEAEIVIAKDTEIIGTLNFIIRIERSPLNEDTTISETELPLIEQAAELAEQIGSIIEEIKDYRETSEAYAIGTRNGIPVESSDPAYHNNAEYWAGQYIGKLSDAQYTALQSLFT